MITATDIAYYYSDGQIGGSGTNCLPQQSLGGDPSNCAVPSSINNLFPSLTTEQTQQGRIDYRCFYIFNNSLTDDLPSSDIYFDTEYDATPQLQIGVNITNDTQKITVAGTPSSGSIVLSFDSVSTASISFGGSVTQFATNIQAALNALASLSGVQVVGENLFTYQTYTITFAGNDGSRYQPLVQLVSNSLSGAPSITISKIINGSPINTIAPVIASGLNPPAGINFYSTSASERLTVGYLKATEAFPVWIKRTIPSGTSPSDLSGGNFRLQGVPF